MRSDFFFVCWPQKTLHGLFSVYRNDFLNVMYVGSLFFHHTQRNVNFECITILSFYKTVKADYLLQVKLLRGMKNSSVCSYLQALNQDILTGTFCLLLKQCIQNSLSKKKYTICFFPSKIIPLFHIFKSMVCSFILVTSSTGILIIHLFRCYHVVYVSSSRLRLNRSVCRRGNSAP